MPNMYAGIMSQSSDPNLHSLTNNRMLSLANVTTVMITMQTLSPAMIPGPLVSNV